MRNDTHRMCTRCHKNFTFPHGGHIIPDHDCDPNEDHQDVNTPKDLHINQGTIKYKPTVSSITGTSDTFKHGQD
jgi:hypothetical protein